MVLQVKGALNYESELTCLFLLQKSALEKFTQFSLPRGVFMNLQGSKLAPRWFKQREDETREAYLARVTVSSTSVSGRLRYRPSDDASLGVLTDQAVATDIIPGWCALSTPDNLVGPEDLESWATQRGFTNISKVHRAGRRRWFFRADLAAGRSDADRVYTFASGISVSWAYNNAGDRKETPVSKPTSSWGTVQPRAGLPTTKPDEEMEPTQPATASLAPADGAPPPHE
eukprot:2011475-Pyramimonas_sp.AAC.1